MVGGVEECGTGVRCGIGGGVWEGGGMWWEGWCVGNSEVCEWEGVDVSGEWGGGVWWEG